MSCEVPRISTMLMQEAEAWSALLALHGATTAATQHTLQSAMDAATSDRLQHDADLQSDAREAAYCAGLTHLASQCDALINEAMRLRVFRKTRCQVQAACVQQIVRSHSDEVLAMGQVMAHNLSIGVASATADLRSAVQQQKAQLSQLQILLETLRTAETLPLKRGARISVCVRHADAQAATAADADASCTEHSIDRIFAEAMQGAKRIDEMSVCNAMRLLYRNADSAPKPLAQQPHTRTARRKGEVESTPPQPLADKPQVEGAIAGSIPMERGGASDKGTGLHDGSPAS